VAFVLVKKLYVREALGEATDVAGEKGLPGVTSAQERIVSPQ
jgi:hypothetical protein